MDRYTYEREALAAGYGLVCGCDEAGAGPLAGLCSLPSMDCLSTLTLR